MTPLNCPNLDNWQKLLIIKKRMGRHFEPFATLESA